MLRTLKSKITVFTAVVIILTMSLITFLVYRVGSNLILENSIHNLESQTRLIANEIENGVTKVTQDLAILSRTPPIQGIIRSIESGGKDNLTNSNLKLWRERLATIFKSMLNVNPSYTQIRYIGVANNGMEIVRVNRTSDTIFETHSSALQQKGGENYFKQGIKLAPGSIFFSDINYNKEHGKIQSPLEPTLRVLMPIYDDKQKLFGLLAININITRYFRDILIRAHNINDLILYNEHGDILLYDEKRGIVKFFDDKNTGDNKLLFHNRTYSKKSFFETLRDDDNLIVVETPIYSNIYRDHSPLNLITAESKANLIKREDFQVSSFIFWISLISLTSTILVYFFAKKITTHLSEMVSSIKLSTHNSGKEPVLPTHLNDEVGLLARAFMEKTEQLHKMAMYDSLTGLPNRKNFIQHLDEAILRAKRTHKALAIGFIDLNDFKHINDTYGHLYGDELLTQFSGTLKNIIRESDHIARLGGDEFAIIAENIEDEDLIFSIFKRYAEHLNQTYVIKGVAIHLTISIGVAIFPEHGINSSDLLSHADEAMYDSKEDKRGIVHIYSKEI